MNKDLIKLMVTLAVVLGFVIFLSTLPSCPYKIGHRASKKLTVHQYDYILEVSDSNNAIFYTIYDEKHHRVGGVTADKLDSLIIADNQ